MSGAGNTPSQTAGPYISMGFSWPGRERLLDPGEPGALELEGQVLDGAGQPVPDAAVEIWQADAGGAFPGPGPARWPGFGRCLTDEEGHFRFTTVKPGRLAAPGGVLQAPHIEVQVFGRGLLRQLFTRIYFADEEEANAQDPALAAIPDRDARATLLAQPTATGYHFDIVLQGERETVFFAR